MARVGAGETGFEMFAREAGARENIARRVGAAVGGAVLTENDVLVPLHDREAAMIAPRAGSATAAVTRGIRSTVSSCGERHFRFIFCRRHCARDRFGKLSATRVRSPRPLRAARPSYGVRCAFATPPSQRNCCKNRRAEGRFKIVGFFCGFFWLSLPGKNFVAAARFAPGSVFAGRARRR
jgi:hypothetical protein